ncbi:MAG: aminotransferase class V-fold PLP-dependent enzyme [Pseudomonadota bacterium]
MKTDRRRFLSQFATGAAALPAALLGARTAFAKNLEALGLDTVSASGLATLRGHYMLDPQVVYLNHASIGTVPRLVSEAHAQYLRTCERNPWAHIWGGEWDEPREQVRQQCAALLHCKASEIALTHNTTEVFNVLAQGLPLEAGDEVLFSSLNHPGASVAFELMAKRRGFTVKRFDFPIDEVSGIAADDVVDVYSQHITDKTRLLVIPHIDNIVGLRYPVEALTRAARSKGVEFVAVDGAQSVGMVPVDVARLDVDVYAASPHKWLQAPKGLGLMYVNERTQPVLEPMWVTWGQDNWQGSARKYEDYGTRNLPELLTLGDAIQFHQRVDMAARERRLRELRNHAKALADDSKAGSWLSPNQWRSGSTICAISLKRGNAKEVAKEAFEKHGMVCRGFTSEGLNSVRLSPSVFTTKREIEQFFEFL